MVNFPAVHHTWVLVFYGSSGYTRIKISQGKGRTIRNPEVGRGGRGLQFPPKKFLQGKFSKKENRVSSSPSKKNRVSKVRQLIKIKKGVQTFHMGKKYLQPSLTRKKFHALEIFCPLPGFLMVRP